MKKIVMISLAMFLFGMTGSAFAATFTSDGGTGDGLLADYKTSKNVNLTCTSSVSAYAAISKHLNGTRQFGSASGDSILYWEAADVGTSAATPTTSLSSEFDGWTKL